MILSTKSDIECADCGAIFDATDDGYVQAVRHGVEKHNAKSFMQTSRRVCPEPGHSTRSRVVGYYNIRRENMSSSSIDDIIQEQESE